MGSKIQYGVSFIEYNAAGLYLREEFVKSKIDFSLQCGLSRVFESISLVGSGEFDVLKSGAISLSDGYDVAFVPPAPTQDAEPITQIANPGLADFAP